MMKDNKREAIISLLNELLDGSQTRPYLFRTRFERSMLRTLNYANEIGNIELYDAANKSLNKLKFITDKSNTTSCGMLRSYVLLEDDMKHMIALV